MNAGFKITVSSVQAMLNARLLNRGGMVQQFVDRTVINYCQAYVPRKSGRLGTSAYGSSIGSGTVVFSVPYAQRQYYENKGNGLRGRLWFERMKADRGREIVAGAQSLVGGRK